MTNAECSWCTLPVEEAGDTCGKNCYDSYLIALALEGGYITMNDTPPKDLMKQPWYKYIAGRDAT